MEDDYKKLVTDCKSFLKTKYDLLRLELLDKLSIILGLLVFIIVGLFILLAAVAYFSLAIIDWMATCMPISVAYCIFGGVLLLLLLTLYIMRKKWFVDPFIKLLSSSLFASEITDENLKTDEDETVV